jgi:hypothetical protein
MTREGDESWHDCLMRIAGPWQLEFQVDALFQEFMDEGLSDKEAAFSAAYELDLLEYVRPESSETPGHSPEEEESDDDEDSIGVEVQEFFAREDEAAGGGKPGREL